MADISMCTSVDCPSRFVCYRFTAKPNAFQQSYLFPEPKLLSDSVCCILFWDNRSNKKEQKK